MSIDRQWLDLGLDALPAANADRVRLFRLVLASAARMRSTLDRELSVSGITTQQAALLQCIQAQPEPPAMGTVAAALSMTHQNVKQIALVLQRKGFLDIVVDAADRRVRRLALTPHHHQFWQQRNPQDFAVVEAMSAGLDEAEVRALVDLLGRLLAQPLAPAPDPPANHALGRMRSGKAAPTP
jgi:DNA-binding MarR family transcriptional regulator